MIKKSKTKNKKTKIKTVRLSSEVCNYIKDQGVNLSASVEEMFVKDMIKNGYLKHER